MTAWRLSSRSARLSVERWHCESLSAGLGLVLVWPVAVMTVERVWGGRAGSRRARL